MLAVLLYHFGAPLADGGSIGVDVFFVISGFVVTTNMLVRSSAPRHLRMFWIRRVARLAPVLGSVLLAVVTGWGLDGGLDSVERAVLVAAMLMHSSVAAVLLGTGTNALTHLWSLTVELHYYLAIAALVGLWTKRHPARRVRSGCLCLLVLGLAVAVMAMRWGLVNLTGTDRAVIYLGTPTRADGLLLGTAIALAPVTWQRSLARRSLASVGLALLATLVVISPRWFDAPTVALGRDLAAANLATGAIVVTIAAGHAAPLLRAILSWRPLVWIGERSYSIYLWHFPVGVGLLAGGSETFQGPVVFALQVGLGIGVGAISFRLIEAPARRWIIARWAS